MEVTLDKKRKINDCGKRGKTGFALGILLICLAAFSMSGAAGQEEKTFCYELTVDGKDTVTVQKGDIITITCTLERTDAAEEYLMYAMQDEISYDSSCLKLVEDSVMTRNEIRPTDIAIQDDMRRFYVNYVSMEGGSLWKERVLLGNFQMEVTGESGEAHVTSENFLVSKEDGTDNYFCEAKDLTVIIAQEDQASSETGETGTDATEKTQETEGTDGEESEKPQDPAEGDSIFGKCLMGILLTVILLLLLLAAILLYDRKRRSEK